jgi:hypothetical protein
MIESMLQDARRAGRVLLGSPGLLVVSVLSLGLGLGVNLTLFTAVRAIFFHTPSMAYPDRVVGVEPGNSNQLSYLNFRDLQASGIFESVAGFRRVTLNLRGRDQVERVSGLAVTANFFEMLGVPTAIGRPFTAAEAAAESHPRVAVLSFRFWQLRFNEDPFIDVRTLRDATGTEAAMRRLGMRLFGVLGLIALLLATIGLYGVMAFVVSSRTREIGTRVALGAASGQILRGVLGQGLRLVATGIAMGALVSWLLARALTAGLAGLSPADPIAFGSASLILLLVGLAACYFPARRAASLNPVEALRVE